MDLAGNLVFLALLFGLMYFMLIRPQKRRMDEHRKLVSSIDPGDTVITMSGMYGTVKAIGDDDVELEIAPGTTVRVVKNAIGRRVTEELEAPAE